MGQLENHHAQAGQQRQFQWTCQVNSRGLSTSSTGGSWSILLHSAEVVTYIALKSRWIHVVLHSTVPTLNVIAL